MQSKLQLLTGPKIELGSGTEIPTIIGSAVFHWTLKKPIFFKTSATQLDDLLGKLRFECTY